MDPNSLKPEDIWRAVTYNSFSKFVEWLWPAVCAEAFIPAYHIDAICEHLQAVRDGHIKNLLVNIGIRHGKSLLANVFFPAWLWSFDPTYRFITATFSERLSMRDAQRCRQLIQSDLYQRYYGKVFGMLGDQNTKSYFKNSHGGERLSCGVGSKLAGFDADIVIADDLIDLDKRRYEQTRTQAIEFFEKALCSRIVRTGKEATILIGNRVHEADQFAYIREKYADDGEWTYLILSEHHKPRPWFNAIGWADKRQEGELLDPVRFPEAVLTKEKKKYRSDFACIYEQEPAPAEGNLFNAQHFRYYTSDDKNYYLNGKAVKKADCWRLATVDLAIATCSSADYTVCQIWDLIGPYAMLVHQHRSKHDGTKLVPVLKGLYEAYKPSFMAVEKVAFQQMVIDQLRHANVPIKSFRPEGDKEIRSIPAQIMLEGGFVYFPAAADYLADLETELKMFPNGKHDDIVDCFSCLAILAQKYSRGQVDFRSDEEKSTARQEMQKKQFRSMLLDGLRGI